MANMQNKTKVITGVNSRFSYFHGWEPISINGGAEKYSVSVLIPKAVFGDGADRPRHPPLQRLLDLTLAVEAFRP